MATRTPRIGRWYQSESSHDVFEIVALDEHSGMIEIQYENGDISEMEFETWHSETCFEVPNPEYIDSDFGLDSEYDDEEGEFEGGVNWRYNLGDSDFEDLGGFEGNPR